MFLAITYAYIIKFSILLIFYICINIIIFVRPFDAVF
jgi:uncharacterized membrane protein